MGEWPNRRRSGRWVAVLAAAASSFSTAATARVRKHTAGLVYGALLLALLEDFGTPSSEGPFASHQWAAPDAAHLAAIFSEAVADPARLKELGAAARRRMVERYGGTQP